MPIEDVYQDVAAAGAPFVLPGPWQALASDTAFFRLLDPAAMLETLRTKFEESLLVESGVLQSCDDGTMAMNPVLASPGTIVWALRKEADASPFSLIANLKSVRPKRWAFCLGFLRLPHLADDRRLRGPRRRGVLHGRLGDPVESERACRPRPAACSSCRARRSTRFARRCILNAQSRRKWKPRRERLPRDWGWLAS